MKMLQSEKYDLVDMDSAEMLNVSGGVSSPSIYMPGCGPGGIGAPLTLEQAKYLFHEIGDFCRGFWDGL